MNALSREILKKFITTFWSTTGYLSPEARYWIEKNNGFISVYNEYKLLMKRDDYEQSEQIKVLEAMLFASAEPLSRDDL